MFRGVDVVVDIPDFRQDITPAALKRQPRRITAALVKSG
jgi:hypothetical protein